MERTVSKSSLLLVMIINAAATGSMKRLQKPSKDADPRSVKIKELLFFSDTGGLQSLCGLAREHLACPLWSDPS